MSQMHAEVLGTLQPDGSLVLDEKPNIPPGRVRVIVSAVPQAPLKEDWWEYMQRTRRELEAAGSPFMTEEEVNAHIEWLREGDAIDDLLRQVDEERQRQERPGC